MEIRNLYTFLQVASTLNITQASEILGYSQSNVSMQIQQLESELKVKLFDRIGHATDEEITGTLRLGIVESVFTVCFKELISRYNKRFPKVRIDVTVDGTFTLQKLLVKNEIDVACLIDNPLTNNKLANRYSRQVEIIMVINKNHPLANKENLSFSDLGDQHVVLMEDTAPYNVLFQQHLATLDAKIEPFLTLQSCEMARKLVEKENYISLLPTYSVKESLHNDKISVLSIDDYHIHQHVQVVISKQKFITPLIEGFIDIASDVLDDVLAI